MFNNDYYVIKLTFLWEPPFHEVYIIVLIEGEKQCAIKHYSCVSDDLYCTWVVLWVMTLTQNLHLFCAMALYNKEKTAFNFWESSLQSQYMLLGYLGMLWDILVTGKTFFLLSCIKMTSWIFPPKNLQETRDFSYKWLWLINVNVSFRWNSCRPCRGLTSSPSLCSSGSGTKLGGTIPGRSLPPALIILLITALFFSWSMSYQG